MKRVFQFFAIFNLIMVAATYSGVEKGDITMLCGGLLVVVFFALSVLFAHLGDMFYKK